MSKKESLTHQLDQLIDLLSEYKPQVEEALDQATETINKEAKKALDEQPLVTLGVTALFFMVIGFLLGRKSKG